MAAKRVDAFNKQTKPALPRENDIIHISVQKKAVTKRVERFAAAFLYRIILSAVYFLVFEVFDMLQNVKVFDGVAREPQFLEGHEVL